MFDVVYNIDIIKHIYYTKLQHLKIDFYITGNKRISSNMSRREIRR